MISSLAYFVGLRLRVGSRVRLSGGYDMNPRWLNGQCARTGKCIAFIKGQNNNPAAVVELDEQITVDGATGKIVVLELRYSDSRWARQEIVHIELCDFVPENKAWKERKQGKWVESHARYTVF